MGEDNLRLAVALNGYGLETYAPGGGPRDLLPWDELVGLARLAEDLGYEVVLTPEIRGREAFATLAGFAMATERIRLGTGVVPLSGRRLDTLVMAASSLDEMSGGRVVLGVGSVEAVVRTRERLGALRGGLGAHRGPASGEEHEAGPTDWDPAPRRVPVWLAALGPRMTALSGEAADGVVLNWCTPERVAEARAAIPRREGFTLSVYVRCCLSHVDDHAVSALKGASARYVANVVYARQMAAMGLGREAALAAEGLGRGPPPEEAVPDRLIQATCVWGDRERALARLGEYRDAGADLVVVYPVPAQEAATSLAGTLMAAAPDPAVEH